MIYIVVLGNSHHNIRRARVDVAVKYYRKLSDLHAKLIFSGGGGTKPSEAQVMYNYAINELNVEPDDCLLETKSQTTIQNIEFTLEMLINNDLVTPKDQFIICTSAFHLPRAYLISEFLIGPNVKVIGTNERITADQKNKEMAAIYSYVEKQTEENRL